MGLLEMQLLGGFALHYEHRPLTTLYQTRERALLAYLALHAQRPVTRAFLAYHFWPDSTEKQARSNLRHSLFQFRHKSPDLDGYLQLDSDTVQWQTAAPFLLDVANFRAVLARVDSEATSADLDVALATAQQLYQGEFMAGFYEEWILETREQLRQHYSDALGQVVTRLEAERTYTRASYHAQQLLHLDPLREATYRTLMRLYALQGDLTGVRETYHHCVDALHTTLDVAPEEETSALYAQLMAQRGRPSTMQNPYHSHSTVDAPTSAPDPLIGRQTEWQHLQRQWRMATMGNAHFVLIAGETGIGKTRLAEELLQWAERLGIPTARAKAYGAEGRLPYSPIVSWLRASALQPQQANLSLGHRSELSRLLPELTVQQSTLPTPAPLTDTYQRQRFFDALAQAVTPRQRQLLLLLDDLQWCDQETLEWLHYLLRQAVGSPLLVLGTVRVGELHADHPIAALRHNLQVAGQLAVIELEPLSQDESAALAIQAAQQSLDEAQLAQLHTYAGGIPLFIVETVRSGHYRHLVEQNIELQAPLPEAYAHEPQPLPSKVQAVIQARLETLSMQARELLDVAAVFGRAVSGEVLAQANNTKFDSTLATLDELWQRRLLRDESDRDYDIVHDRIRDVVYQTLNPLRKRQLHWRAARALEVCYADDLDKVNGQLAVHYERAGLIDRAIPYYRQAGATAQQIFACSEAISYYNRGLHLVKRLPHTLERDRQELDLLLALGVALVALHGYSINRVRETYLLANALVQKINGRAHGPILRALAISAVTRGEFAQADIYGTQLLELALSQGNSLLTVEAHYSLGVTRFWQGDFTTCAKHLRQAVEIYQPANREEHLRLFAQDPLPICQIRYAGVLWHLGCPTQAAMWIKRAVDAAETEAHPHTVAYVRFWQALIMHFHGDFAQTIVLAEAATTHAETYQLPFWSSESLILWGWAEVHQRLAADSPVDDTVIAEGIAKITKGIAVFQALDSGFFLAYYQGLLAAVNAKVGKAAIGAEQIAAALVRARHQREDWCLAKLLHLQANIQLALETASGQHDKPRGVSATLAERYQEAIAVAHEQGTKSWHLQILIDLYQLAREHGDPAEAKAQLSDLLATLTEGKEYLSWQAAHQLLY